MSRWRFRLLYDGQCPFCRREVDWLKRRDRHGRLAVEDISALGFDPAWYDLRREEVVRVLHGVKPDGTVLRRMDAVREAYRTVGLGWMMAPTRLPLVRPITDRLYELFARNRERWGAMLGRRCDGGSCDAGSSARNVATRPPSVSARK